jgi:hypothetical protein
MANDFFKILEKPFVGFASPFLCHLGGENSPQKQTPGGYISKSFL